jgi:hypothetical protein
VTLPAGPLGVSGSSKKQKAQAALVREAQAQTRLLRATQEGLGDALSAERAKAKADLQDAKRERVRARTRASKLRRSGLKPEADEEELLADLYREEIERLRNFLNS